MIYSALQWKRRHKQWWIKILLFILCCFAWTCGWTREGKCKKKCLCCVCETSPTNIGLFSNWRWIRWISPFTWRSTHRISDVFLSVNNYKAIDWRINFDLVVCSKKRRTTRTSHLIDHNSPVQTWFQRQQTTTLTPHHWSSSPPPSSTMSSASSEQQRSNKILISRNRNLYFYVNLAKKYLQDMETVELSGLGQAINIVVSCAEILKNQQFVQIVNIETSTASWPAMTMRMSCSVRQRSRSPWRRVTSLMSSLLRSRSNWPRRDRPENNSSNSNSNNNSRNNLKKLVSEWPIDWINCVSSCEHFWPTTTQQGAVWLALFFFCLIRFSMLELLRHWKFRTDGLPSCVKLRLTTDDIFRCSIHRSSSINLET